MSRISVVEFELDDGGKAFVNPASVSYIGEGKSFTNFSEDGSGNPVTLISMFSWQISVIQPIDEVRRKIFGI